LNDQWNEKLWRRKCGKTGMASLSQDNGAATPIVQSIPDGFKVVQTEYGPDFHCEACTIAVQ
jgi:hypothetical protein